MQLQDAASRPRARPAAAQARPPRAPPSTQDLALLAKYDMFGQLLQAAAAAPQAQVLTDALLFPGAQKAPDALELLSLPWGCAARKGSRSGMLIRRCMLCQAWCATASGDVCCSCTQPR